ncbi:MAG: DNA polymerase/3'-5' exonuclease PolX [Deltaproteobacteria bacterium]|nr:DNA polymerase/3'-5' exonuclease PolX [Deltaproteobacteria bacterium]
MEKKQLVKNLSEIAELLEIRGDNPFRSRAFQNGARIIESLSEDIFTLVKNDELKNVKGIGKGLNQEIKEMLQEGKSTLLEELHAEIPEGVRQMLQVPGLGPKKVKTLWQDLELKNLGELEYACHENRLVELKGFGEKTQANVLKGIRLLKKNAGRFLLNLALAEAKTLVAFLESEKNISRCEIAGSLRRSCETIGDIDILVSLKKYSREASQKISQKFVHYKEVEETLLSGETKTSVRLKSGIQVDLRIVDERSFPFAWLYFTGNKDHNTVLRKLAKEKGFKLNEYGLFHGEKSLDCQNEEEIYRALELHYIPPELRENLGEIEFALKQSIPYLVDQKDLQGVFHVHSTWSDGNASILQMGQAAEKLGFQYLGLSDHSQSAFYAGGLKPEELALQRKEIIKANEKLHHLTILQGIESDILSDGSLDYSDAQLKNLDFVIGSLHSGFKMAKEKMMARLLKAIQNKRTKMIGHISTRLLLARDGIDIDYEKIFTAAAEHQVVIEINANPHRFDLDWRYLKKAKLMGVKFAINPDAHSPEGLEHTFLGVGIARKGWLQKEDILNTKSLDEIREMWS